MHIFFIFSAVLATCLGETITPEELVNTESEYAYAVDVAGLIPVDAFACMKKYGYNTAFIRAYDPAGSGRFDMDASDNVRRAHKAGLGVEVYMRPQPHSSKKGAQQFKELYEGLTRDEIKVKTVWLQVTSPVDWNHDSRVNTDFLIDIISMAKQYNVVIAFYSNFYDWRQITKDATAEGAMLWYWNINGLGLKGETPANFDDFRPFSKFTRPTVKQFAQEENTKCGVKVNRDVYKASNQFLSSATNTSNSELIVGAFGAGQDPRRVRIL